MMDHAEFRGGRNCDNLSMVAMRYGEEKFDDDELVLGDDLGLDGFTTQLRQIGQREPGRPSSDEMDIDQAVAEIHSALAKYGLNKQTQ